MRAGDPKAGRRAGYNLYVPMAWVPWLDARIGESAGHRTAGELMEVVLLWYCRRLARAGEPAVAGLPAGPLSGQRVTRKPLAPRTRRLDGLEYAEVRVDAAFKPVVAELCRRTGLKRGFQVKTALEAFARAKRLPPPAVGPAAAAQAGRKRAAGRAKPPRK
jgi:hypothetical protein